MSVESKGHQGNLMGRRSFLAAAAAVGGFVIFKMTRTPSAHAAAKDLPANVTIIQFGPDGQKMGPTTVARVVKPNAEWRNQLSPLAYDVTREEGTERPFSSDQASHGKGIYRCICCQNALFDSATKFDSGTGWPSFFKTIAKENVVEKSDYTLGMKRTAVSCRECDAHLGHVFDDGPEPTGLRYCMNAVAMQFAKS